VEEHLETALAQRLACLLDGDTDAYRLFSGRGDGISGLIAEKLADVAVLEVMQGKFDGGEPVMQAAAKWYARTLGLSTVYAKTLPRDRSAVGRRPAKPAPRTARPLAECAPIWGAAGDDAITVRESGIAYLVKPKERYQVGLFLDQRENRRRLAELAEGRRVLNLFAYTCAFSIAAARGGAASTASVDVSKKVLEWGKLNFGANDIPLDTHRFYCCEAFAFYQRAKRQGLEFDVAILDPPTFSRTKNPPGVFQVEKDMVRLIQGAIDLLAPRGVMLVSTNHRELTEGWVRAQVQTALGRRPFKFLKPVPQQIDFLGSRESSKSVWVSI
jgi:23S rRNA (cytosine1962-C5)-methyltransferase